MEHRKTEIIIQTRERIFVRHLENELQMFCPNCRMVTVFITPENGACVTETSVRTIFRNIEGGSVHFIETGAGLMFICRQSLEEHELSARF